MGKKALSLSHLNDTVTNLNGPVMRKGVPRVVIPKFMSVFMSFWKHLSISPRRTKRFASRYLGKDQDNYEKRTFPRFLVTEPVVCFRYGRRMTMRTQNISLDGLKVTANFELGVGESMDLAILTNNARIHCRGRILAIEDYNNRVHARFRLAPTSETDFRKLSDYLDGLSRGRFHKGVIAGLFILTAYIAYLTIRTYFFQ